jgi:hypothetical protein
MSIEIDPHTQLRRRLALSFPDRDLAENGDHEAAGDWRRGSEVGAIDQRDPGRDEIRAVEVEETVGPAQMHLDGSTTDHLQIAETAVAAEVPPNPIGDHRLQVGEIGADLPIDRALPILRVRTAGVGEPDRPSLMDEAVAAGMRAFEPLAPETARLARHRIRRHCTRTTAMPARLMMGFTNTCASGAIPQSRGSTPQGAARNPAPKASDSLS